MYTHQDNKQKHQVYPSAFGLKTNELIRNQRKRRSSFQFLDNRPEAIAQGKWQKIADKRPETVQLASIQLLANKYLASRRIPTQANVLQLLTSEDDLNEVDDVLHPAAKAVLQTPSGKALAAQCQADGKPSLKIRVSPRPGYPATGANYDYSTNTITISPEVVGAGKKKIEQSIRWELQNSESAETFRAIAASTPDHGTDLGHAFHMVYHYEKTEYFGLVRHFHASKQEGGDFEYERFFLGGRQAPWSSFFKYLSEQVKLAHYKDKWTSLAKGVPMMGEFESFLAPEDYVEHDWVTETTPKYNYTPPSSPIPLSGQSHVSMISFEEDMTEKAAAARQASKTADILDLFDQPAPSASPGSSLVPGMGAPSGPGMGFVPPQSGGYYGPPSKGAPSGSGMGFAPPPSRGHYGPPPMGASAGSGRGFAPPPSGGYHGSPGLGVPSGRGMGPGFLPPRRGSTKSSGATTAVTSNSSPGSSAKDPFASLLDLHRERAGSQEEKDQ